MKIGCKKFTRQCLGRVYPPVFGEGLPASLWGGFTRQSLGGVTRTRHWLGQAAIAPEAHKSFAKVS